MPSRLVPDINPTYSSGGCGTEYLVELGEVGIAQQVQARNEIVCRHLERGHVFMADGRRIRQGDAQRVTLLAVDLEFVVQVRAAGQTGHADITDHVALCHALAAVQSLGKARQMPVDGGEAALVADRNEVAVAALFAEGRDDAVRGRLDLGDRKSVV